MAMIPRVRGVRLLAEIAEKARPGCQCNGRVDKAVAIGLAGDVELLANGTAKVASQSNGTTVYHVVNGHCDCRDFAKAPHQFCKHRLSAAIARRTQELTTAKLADIAARLSHRTSQHQRSLTSHSATARGSCQYRAPHR